MLFSPVRRRSWSLVFGLCFVGLSSIGLDLHGSGPCHSCILCCGWFIAWLRTAVIGCYRRLVPVVPDIDCLCSRPAGVGRSTPASFRFRVPGTLHPWLRRPLPSRRFTPSAPVARWPSFWPFRLGIAWRDLAHCRVVCPVARVRVSSTPVPGTFAATAGCAGRTCCFVACPRFPTSWWCRRADMVHPRVVRRFVSRLVLR